MPRDERRRHPRIALRLPIRCAATGEPPPEKGADYTLDVAPGGVCFSTIGWAPPSGGRVSLELSIPPGEGYFPYTGKIIGAATVLRCQKAPGVAPARWVVAARFDQPLNLQFP
jgi:hypothetical protein